MGQERQAWLCVADDALRVGKAEMRQLGAAVQQDGVVPRSIIWTPSHSHV